MGTHSCSSGPMQLTDSELRFGLFADAREKKRKKISPAPETIQSLSLLLVGRDESLLSWKVGHSVQACWAFTHNIHRVLHHSTKHRIGINVVSVSFRVTCSQLKEPTEIIHLIRDTTRTVGWSRWAARFRGKALLWHPYWKLLPYLDWYLSTHLHLCCKCSSSHTFTRLWLIWQLAFPNMSTLPRFLTLVQVLIDQTHELYFSANQRYVQTIYVFIWLVRFRHQNCSVRVWKRSCFGSEYLLLVPQTAGNVPTLH